VILVLGAIEKSLGDLGYRVKAGAAGKAAAAVYAEAGKSVMA
jgi:hypothetical protein